MATTEFIGLLLPVVGLLAIPVLVIMLHAMFEWWRKLRVTFVILGVWFFAVSPVYIVLAKAYTQAIERDEQGTAVVDNGELSPLDNPRSINIIQRKVRLYANQYDLDPNIFLAQVYQESRFDAGAIGAAGEHGLGQIMPVVSAWCGNTHEEMFDPDLNLDCAARYMVYLTNYYDGDGYKALAAYNFGPGNVNDSLATTGDIPNHHYVDPILANAPKYARPLMPYLATPTETRWGAGAYHPAPMGRDFKVGCGGTLVAPINGVVTYAGREWGFIGTHASHKSGDHKYNTLLIISGRGEDAGWEFTLMHQDTLVETGDVVLKGVTVIGREASEGNSTGCHTHISVKRYNTVIDYFANYGVR